MIILNLRINGIAFKTMVSYVTWMLILLSLILKLKVSTNIDDDVEKTFDTSDYEVNRPLPKGKNKKVIGMMKDELGGKIMTEFLALRPKTYSYLMDDANTNCLLKNKIILKSQERFKSEAHNVYTEKINKIALSINDDKRLQTFDRVT